MPKKEKDFDRQKRIFKSMVEKDPLNNYCAECGAKGPQWASTNLGVFLCIRCASIHRKLGTHISKVKSLTLDNWNMEQLEDFQRLGGNSVSNDKYLGKGYPRPEPLSNNDEDVETFIRDKYEKKYYMNSQDKEEEIKKSFTDNDYRKYSLQLDSLKDMGFCNETHNLMLLKQLNGNIDAVAEILLTESSQIKNNDNNNNNSNNNNNRKPDSFLSSSSSSSNPINKKPSNINTQTIIFPTRSVSMSGRSVTPSPRKSSLNHLQSFEYSNGLNQLKSMGFTDITQMKSALIKVFN
ncbi:ArfGap-domain-containing protein [Piromyces finnis]|uniref:ArfGap-domain-containing protein n=1 Tax=Piromyces finnis TaxID=1754191 RepID=A0A1Y1VKI8_9FUNG|nr:ArfGap-domain-containing protein [Piromyces finnis]|eukprot:ORX58565.1 ArfGap-domain-containing protein [Piromyces finnis]